MGNKSIKKVHAAGFLMFRSTAENKFQFLLLTKFNGETDIPKGHLENKETPKEGAIRELWEETGIKANYIIEENFLFECTYFPPKQFGKAQKEKKLTVYLAKLLKDQQLKMTEHSKFEWVDYNPPHTFKWPPSLNTLFEEVLKYEKEGKLDVFLNKNQ